MDTNGSTKLMRAADELLRVSHQTDLKSVLTEWQGIGASYEGMARRLLMMTGGVIDVSSRTIRRWMEDMGLAA